MSSSRKRVVAGIAMAAILCVILLLSRSTGDGHDPAPPGLHRKTETREPAGGTRPPTPDILLEDDLEAEDSVATRLRLLFSERITDWEELPTHPEQDPGDEPEPPERFLTGRVVLPTGEPAAGATVTFHAGHEWTLRSPGGTGSPDARETYTTTADSDGRFRVPRSEIPRPLAIWMSKDKAMPGAGLYASSPAGVSWWQTIDFEHWKSDVGDLILRAPLVVRVLVTDPGEAPLPGAHGELCARRPRDPGDSEADPYEVVSLLAVGDARGELTFPAIPRMTDWTASLHLTHPGAVRSWEEFPIRDSLAGRTVVVVMHRGVAIRGRLLEAAGRPAAGVGVRIGVRVDGFQHLESSAATTTDDLGRFEVKGVDAGYGILGFAAGATTPYCIDWTRGGEGETIDAGTILLPDTSPIKGTVLSESGRPVPSAAVRLSPSGLPHENVSVHTREHGRFEFARLYPGTYRLEAWIPGADGDSIPAVAAAVEAGATEVRMKASRAGTLLLVFRSTDRPQQPLRIASLQVRRTRGSITSWETVENVTTFRVLPEPGEGEVELIGEGFFEKTVEIPELSSEGETVLEVHLQPR